MINSTREYLENQLRLSAYHIRNAQGVVVVVCVKRDEYGVSTWALPGGGQTSSHRKALHAAKAMRRMIGESWR